MVVTTIHPIERAIVHGLQTVFDAQITPAGGFRSVNPKPAVDTVGSCADRQADHVRMSHGLFKKRPQDIDRGIGVRGRLKIRHEPLDAVALSQASDAVVDLFGNRPAPHASTWAETTIVAESAAADRDRAIDVWASEARVDANFLHALAKFSSQEEIVAMVAQAFRPPSRLIACGRLHRVRGGHEFGLAAGPGQSVSYEFKRPTSSDLQTLCREWRGRDFPP